VDHEAETIAFHFVNARDVPVAQGMENLVRRTPNYAAWRAAWEACFEKTGDEAVADRETQTGWFRVIAEDPVHAGT